MNNCETVGRISANHFKWWKVAELDTTTDIGPKEMDDVHVPFQISRFLIWPPWPEIMMHCHEEFEEVDGNSVFRGEKNSLLFFKTPPIVSHGQKKIDFAQNLWKNCDSRGESKQWLWHVSCWQEGEFLIRINDFQISLGKETPKFFRKETPPWTFVQAKSSMTANQHHWLNRICTKYDADIRGEHWGSSWCLERMGKNRITPKWQEQLIIQTFRTHVNTQNTTVSKTPILDGKKILPLENKCSFSLIATPPSPLSAFTHMGTVALFAC